MLPYTAGDFQQVERKRHIGNDLVVIIFQVRERERRGREGENREREEENREREERFNFLRDQESGGTFDPSSLVSNMNHTYLIVRKVEKPENYVSLVPDSPDMIQVRFLLSFCFFTFFIHVM